MLKLFIFLTLFISTYVFSEVIEKPLLYKVTKDMRSSYLMGTIHTAVKWSEVPSFVHTQLERSELVAMEANILGVDPKVTASYQYYPEGDSLRNHISSEVWNQITGKLSHIPASQLERFRPWIINSMLLQTLVPASQSHAEVAMDIAIINSAKELGKALSYMESWVSQMQLMTQLIPASRLEEILANYGSNQDEDSSSTVSSMVADYRAGNQQGLCDVAMEGDEQQLELLMYSRNKKWIPVIDMLHYSFKEPFIAVGAGHFCGVDSVLQLLRDNGYLIERVER